MADQASPAEGDQSQTQATDQGAGTDGGQPTPKDGDQNQPKGFETLFPKDYRHLIEGSSGMTDFMQRVEKAFKTEEQALVMPGEEASQEDWGEFYKALGRPDSPDGYQLSAPDGARINQDLAKEFRAKAYQLGLTNSQAQEIFGWYGQSAERINQMSDQARVEQARHVERRLRDEWGADYDANAELIRRAARQLGSPELQDFVERTGMGSDYGFAKFMARVGSLIKDDSFDMGSRTTEESEREKLKKRYKSHADIFGE